MRRSDQVFLVLLGGGALMAGVAGAAIEQQRECLAVQDRLAPTAVAACRSGSFGYQVSFGVRRSFVAFADVEERAGRAVRAVRGGFGHAGLHFGFHG